MLWSPSNAWILSSDTGVRNGHFHLRCESILSHVCFLPYFYMCHFLQQNNVALCRFIYFFLLYFLFWYMTSSNLVNKINSFLLSLCLFLAFPAKRKIHAKKNFLAWISPEGMDRNGSSKFVVLIQKEMFIPAPGGGSLGIRTTHSIYSSISLCAVTAGSRKRHGIHCLLNRVHKSRTSLMITVRRTSFFSGC